MLSRLAKTMEIHLGILGLRLVISLVWKSR